MQAQINFDAVIISLPDGSISVAAGSAGSVGGGGQRQDASTIEGEFRNYANGVTRLILGATNTRILTFVLRAVDQNGLNDLLGPDRISGMLGKTVCLRDSYGKKVFGSFLTATVTDIPHSSSATNATLADIMVTFQMINYDEAV